MPRLRFRLSTMIFLLVLLGWAMATRPYWTQEVSHVVHASSGECGLATEVRGPVLPNPRLLGPALALVAFFCWKGHSRFLRVATALTAN